MPLHKEFDLLDQSIRSSAITCIEEMRADPDIKKAGYVYTEPE